MTESDFTEIINKNDEKLRHLSRVYAECTDEMKDIYQEIIISIWQSLSSFNGEASIGTWIYRVAINTAISFARKKKVRHRYYASFKKEKEAQDTVMVGLSDNEKGGKADRLYEAISKLNASEKALITMYLEDFSYREIAFVTNITENYVGVKLHRIKQKLSNIIDHGTE
jgi:RNA polymerase sigma-70 factor (ECF subfamily)